MSRSGGHEVAVIGAGIHGASAAYHLARAGARVVVLERLTPAGGPTGLSSGVCRAYYTNHFLAEAARDSLRMMAAFEEFVPGFDAAYRRTGFLFLHPPEDTAEVIANAEQLNELGIRVEVYEADALRREFPQFELDGIGLGVLELDAGYADPAGTTAGVMAGAIAAGAMLRSRTSVEEIVLRPGGGAVLGLGGGERLEAERLLIAAGPWTAPLAHQLGVDLPLTVERHVVAIARLEHDRAVPFGHGDLRTGYYCRPEGNNQYLLGWTHAAEQVDPDRYDATLRRDEGVALLEAAARTLPALDNAQPMGGWASLYDVSPDWQPVIGEIADGVFVDAGTSGHGFKLAPALGKKVAELVLGDPDRRLGQFHPDRFAAGELLLAGYRGARILG